MPFKDREKRNAWQRNRTAALNARGLTHRKTKKIRFTRPPRKPVADAELDQRMGGQ